MIDQQNEYLQAKIERAIYNKLNELYGLLLESDRLEASEVLGIVAEAKAVWENDTGSFGEEA
jgi:hypothetical protein